MGLGWSPRNFAIFYHYSTPHGLKLIGLSVEKSNSSSCTLIKKKTRHINVAETLCMCVCVGGGWGRGVCACVCVRGHISSLISLPSSDGSEKLSCIFTHDIDASVLEFAWSFKHDFLRAENELYDSYKQLHWLHFIRKFEMFWYPLGTHTKLNVEKQTLARCLGIITVEFPCKTQDLSSNTFGSF